MKALGKHLIVELYGCDKSILDHDGEIREYFVEAVERIGATIIKPFFYKYSPHGITGVIVIAESHLSIHTWPEYGYCALDIFTCGEEIDGLIALHYLKKKLKAKTVSVMEIKRGILDLPEGEIRHKAET